MPDTILEPLDELRAAKRKNRELRRVREARRIEKANNLMESLGVDSYYAGSPWAGNFYAMLDRYNQQFIGATNRNDRRWGRNIPIWMNEIDLQVARMPSRILTATNQYAIGILEAWTSYIVGEGFVKTVKAKEAKENRVPKSILAKLQGVIDDFAMRNDWDGGERPGLEEEFIKRPEVDGAAILCLHEDDAGLTWASTIECEQLTAPPGSDMDYLFGIYTPRDNPQRPEKFFLKPLHGEAQEGQEYDADQIVYFKTNATRQMKVGFPSFTYSTLDTIKLSDELRQNLGVGGKIQAGIAVVRQHDSADKQQVQDFSNAMADYQARISGGNGQTENVEVSRPGGTLDIPKGLTYVTPPNAQNAAAHIQILHACLRAATVRYNMPDFVGSGDASSNTYDNSVATGSLFGRRIIRAQKRPAATFQRIFWWALDTRCSRAGVITATEPDGTVVSMSWEQLKTLVEVVVTPASPQERDKKEEADRLALLTDKKLMAPQQAIVELGHNVEETMGQIRTWQKEMPAAQPGPEGQAQPGSGSPQPGEKPVHPGSRRSPMQESVEAGTWVELPDDFFKVS